MGFLNPTEILNKLNLQRGMIIADFGCGSGGWTIPLAKILDQEKIYAFDIQEEMLSGLRNRANLEKINTIEAIKCDLEKPSATGLQGNILDFVLIPNLLFQITNKKSVLEEAKRILKPGGKVLVLDWNPGASFGPKESRVSEEEIKTISKELGLTLEEEFKAGAFHYGLIFKK